MSGYLERLAAGAMRPGGSFHPIAGSPFASSSTPSPLAEPAPPPPLSFSAGEQEAPRATIRGRTLVTPSMTVAQPQAASLVPREETGPPQPVPHSHARPLPPRSEAEPIPFQDSARRSAPERLPTPTPATPTANASNPDQTFPSRSFRASSIPAPHSANGLEPRPSQESSPGTNAAPPPSPPSSPYSPPARGPQTSPQSLPESAGDPLTRNSSAIPAADATSQPPAPTLPASIPHEASRSASGSPTPKSEAAAATAQHRETLAASAPPDFQGSSEGSTALSPRAHTPNPSTPKPTPATFRPLIPPTLAAAVPPPTARNQAKPDRSPREQPPREPDEIHVHIGRIEVMAVPPPPIAAPSAATRKTPSLNDYLRRGNGWS